MTIYLSVNYLGTFSTYMNRKQSNSFISLAHNSSRDFFSLAIFTIVSLPHIWVSVDVYHTYICIQLLANRLTSVQILWCVPEQHSQSSLLCISFPILLNRINPKRRGARCVWTQIQSFEIVNEHYIIESGITSIRVFESMTK